jgi:hypothetical protein
MKRNRYPQGWDARRVKRVLEHYERQTDDEAVAEDEARTPGDVMMPIPNELVPVVRELIEQHHKKGRVAAPTRAKQKTR